MRSWRCWYPSTGTSVLSCAVNRWRLAEARVRAFELSNRENQFPFYLTEDGQDRVPDVYRPNLQYFEFVDRVSAIATELGITLFLVPTWGRWLNGGLHGPPVIFDSDNAYSFANFLGKRYPFHPFILGGDTNRYWNVDVQKAIKGNNLSGVRVIDYGATIEAMARGLIDGEKEAIQALSPDLYDMTGGYTTFITYHSTQGGFLDLAIARCLADWHIQAGSLVHPKPQVRHNFPKQTGCHSMLFSQVTPMARSRSTQIGSSTGGTAGRPIRQYARCTQL